MGVSIEQKVWGLLGAAAAAWFAIWMLFVPDLVPTYFAWDVQPRANQVFIGAGYIFRTAFFLSVVFEANWLRLRWIVWGNLAFTGTLLVATYWHLDQFHWDILHQTPLGHIWIVLYILEPIAMIFLLPRGILRASAEATGGPIHPWFRKYLIGVTAVLLANGLLILANPTFAATRWPWELNELDSRIVAAWFLGWSVWCGTMALASDWDEIRRAAQLFVLCGASLLVAFLLSRDVFLATAKTTGGFLGGLAVLTAAMAVAYVVQERRRPTPWMGPRP
jgi:hypothetical protein